MKECNLTKSEKRQKEADKESHIAELQHENRVLKRLSRSENDWSCLLSSSIQCEDEQKFLFDCLDLFKEGISSTHPVQVAVIKSIVGKLRGGRNYRFSALVKEFATLYRNFLGKTNYSTLTVSTNMFPYLLF